MQDTYSTGKLRSTVMVARTLQAIADIPIAPMLDMTPSVLYRSQFDFKFYVELCKVIYIDKGTEQDQPPRFSNNARLL